MKKRNPIAVLFLPFFTFGIYWLVWYVKKRVILHSWGAGLEFVFPHVKLPPPLQTVNRKEIVMKPLFIILLVLILAFGSANRVFPQLANTKIAFYSNRDGNNEIYVMNVDGTNQTRLTNNLADDANPAWSPDGSKIAFVSNRDGNYEIYVMNPDGTNQTRITNNNANDDNPSWSPDGSKIAFTADRTGNREIFVTNADGSNPLNLTNNSADDGSPHWSPDGTKIKFYSKRDGGVIPDIYVMNSDGSNVRQLTFGLWTGQARWSPDGNKLVYAYDAYVAVMNADGSNKTIILTLSCCPGPGLGSWSPDGNNIVFIDPNAQIYKMNSDGSNRIRLTNNSASDREPSWSPFFGPRLVSVSPSQNALNVSKSTNISVTFNVPMNTSALIASNILVYGSQSGKHTGTITLTGDTSLTFDPTKDFNPGEVLTVNLTKNILSAHGDSLTNGYHWQFTVAAGGGTAVFTQTDSLPVAGHPSLAVAGDFDADGDLDLAVLPVDSNLSIWENDGHGVFVRRSSVAVGSLNVALISGDWNGDGYLDLGSADPDAAKLYILTNDGYASFTGVTISDAGGSPNSLATGDFDGDGDLDLAMTEYLSGIVSIFTNTGAGVFTRMSTISVGGRLTAVATGDLDGDGDLDLAVGGTIGVSILWNDGRGTFRQGPYFNPAVGQVWIAAADIDGDHDLDLCVTNNSDTTVTILVNDRIGNFTQHSPSIWAGGAVPLTIAPADLDGDGDLDMAIPNATSGTVGILRNDGSLNFLLLSTPPSVGQNPQVVIAGDFDADGDLDLATGNYGSNTVSILKNGGGRSFITVTYPNGGETWYKGTAYEIQWNSVNFTSNVQILLQEGAAPAQTITGSVSNTGSYTYTPPCNLETGSDYKIIVAGARSRNPHDQSDASFTIISSTTNDPCAGVFRLKFPLRGSNDQTLNPYCHDIISIFDHSMNDGNYGNDLTDTVMNYRGEFGVGSIGKCPDDSDSYVNPDGKLFDAIQNYVGYKSCRRRYLTYNGHPGYDYRARKTDIKVYSAASGTVHYPEGIKEGGNGRQMHGLRRPYLYHVLEIDHQNGYRSYYLHLSTYKQYDYRGGAAVYDPQLPAEGQYIGAGQFLGYVGGWGPAGPNADIHLHYEVHRDIGAPDQYGNTYRPIDPYPWRPVEPGKWDRYPYANSLSGVSTNLWEGNPNPHCIAASLTSSSGPLSRLGLSNLSTTGSILVTWIFDACEDSVDHFELTRMKSDGTSLVISVPPYGCPFFSYIDNQVEPNESYSYFVWAVFSNSTYSGTSLLSSIYSSPSLERIQTLFSNSLATSPFVIPSEGVYEVSLKQPSQAAARIRGKSRLTSAVDSVGFFLTWELRDSAGNRIDNSSSNVGSIKYTDSSQSFVVSFSGNQTGIWNLTLFGTENIPIGDSVVVTAKVDTTTQAVYTVDKNVVSFYGTPLGGSVIDSVAVTNIGNLPLLLNWTYSGSPRFHIADGSTVISPLGNFSIPIVFLSVDSSYVAGTIIVNHSGATSPDTIELVGRGGPSVGKTIQVASRWNMMSIPIQLEDSSKRNVFPTATSNAFAYESNSGYVRKDTLRTGIGYWLKFPGPESLTLTGIPILAETVTVSEGWNLIGTVAEKVAASSIMSIPPGIPTSKFFGYNGTYQLNDTIDPGKGYWVKVHQTGQLILSSNASASTLVNRIKIVSINELPPPPPGESAEVALEIPTQYALGQNYPNPFNPLTVIRYELPVQSEVALRIYNVLGQEVKTLVNGIRDAGYESVEWDASQVASGVYFYRLEAVSVHEPSNRFTQVRKMVLLR